MSTEPADLPSREFLSHRWVETFARDRFPLVCAACLVRSDRPDAERECDRLAEKVRVATPPAQPDGEASA